MTKKKLIDLLRLLSGIESAMLMCKERIPDHLHDALAETINDVSQEILQPCAEPQGEQK